MTKQEFKELTQEPVLLDGATGSNLMGRRDAPGDLHGTVGDRT